MDDFRQARLADGLNPSFIQDLNKRVDELEKMKVEVASQIDDLKRQQSHLTSHHVDTRTVGDHLANVKNLLAGADAPTRRGLLRQIVSCITVLDDNSIRIDWDVPCDGFDQCFVYRRECREIRPKRELFRPLFQLIGNTKFYITSPSIGSFSSTRNTWLKDSLWPKFPMKFFRPKKRFGVL